MALTLPQLQRNKRMHIAHTSTVLFCSECFDVVWGWGFGSKVVQLWRSPRWGHPAYPGSASPQLLVARHYHPAWQPPEGNPLNPSLLSPPSTYFSARRISGTLASYLFINPHSHPAASQYKNMFLVLHCQVNCGVRKSWDRFVIFCRKMINALHSFGICQTPKIFAPLKWTHRDHSFPHLESSPHIFKAYINVGQQRTPKWWNLQTESLCDQCKIYFKSSLHLMSLCQTKHSAVILPGRENGIIVYKCDVHISLF